MKRMCVVAVVLLCGAGCSLKATGRGPEMHEAAASLEKKKSVQELKKEKREQELNGVIDDARPIIDNLLAAVNTADYEAFVRDLNRAMKAAYHDRTQFDASCRKRLDTYGEAGARPLVNAVYGYNQFYLTYLVKFSALDEPVPVYLCLEKKEDRLEICFLQFRFSTLKDTQP